MSPGGSAWEGEAADAAQDRSFADLVTVRGAADVVHDAASAARRGAEDLGYAKRSALDAVSEAPLAGFVVGEDLSVTSRRAGGDFFAQAKQAALAAQHASTIAARAGDLSALDNKYATMINAAIAPLTEVGFADAPTANGVQLVDNRTVKQAPPVPDPSIPGEPGAGPSAADIRGVIEKLPEGSSSWIREVRTAQDLENLWKWMRQNGVEVPNGYENPAKGTAVTLPDGTRVGQRLVAGSTRQPALDVNIAGERRIFKVHINPQGGVPEIPAPGRPPVVEAPSRLPPVESPSVRGSGPIGGFGGGVVPDGTLPHVVELPKAGDPDLPVIGDGLPDHPDTYWNG